MVLSGPSLSSSFLAVMGASGVSLTSGGKMAYRMRGTLTRHTSPGTIPASAHRPHEISMPAEAARLTERGLAAMAVMNMADETHDVWKQVCIT